MAATAEFVHLHNHTEYSFLDGAIKIKDMVKQAVDFGMPALAITDHGGLFGVRDSDQQYSHRCLPHLLRRPVSLQMVDIDLLPVSSRRNDAGEERFHALISYFYSYNVWVPFGYP